MTSSLLSPRRECSEQLQEQTGPTIPHTRIHCGLGGSTESTPRASQHQHVLLHQIPPLYPPLPSSPQPSGDAASSAADGFCPWYLPFPQHSLRMCLIFAGAGHSPCLNPAEPRSVPLMGANENNKPQRHGAPLLLERAGT